MKERKRRGREREERRCIGAGEVATSGCWRKRRIDGKICSRERGGGRDEESSGRFADVFYNRLLL